MRDQELAVWYNELRSEEVRGLNTKDDIEDLIHGTDKSLHEVL